MVADGYLLKGVLDGDMVFILYGMIRRGSVSVLVYLALIKMRDG